MPAKRTREWYKRLDREWERYVGERATVRDYAAGGAPYRARLRRDLTEWWGNHPQPAKRLSPEKIEAVAGRLADLIQAYLSPITPSEVLDQFRDEWLRLAGSATPDGSAKLKPMVGPFPKPSDENGED